MNPRSRTTPGQTNRRSNPRRVWSLLLLAFIAVPVVEIWVIIQVGHAIGAWWTVLLLLADSVFGAWLVRHEGRRAWTALREALQQGRMPANELADGILLLVGGTLMLAPGFVTDITGMLLILPVTRPLGRRVLGRMLTRRLTVMGPVADMGRPRPEHEDVVPGEVINHERF